MRWMPSVLLLLAGLTWAGCETGPAANGDGGADSAAAAAASEAATAEQARAVQAARAAAVQQVQALPEVGAAEVTVGTRPGGGPAETVAVTVVRADGGRVDDALAQQVVERVLRGLPDVVPSNVAVRDASEPDYLYIGDLGRME
ncbi:MAG: hypothetical protein WDZ31_12110 [Phycisphaeraceae bacterium]